LLACTVAYEVSHGIPFIFQIGASSLPPLGGIARLAQHKLPLDA
jgi:hypothetical protein